MSFRNKLGLDPTTTGKLADFLGGKPTKELSDIDLYLMMRSDIQTKEGINLIQFLSLVGHKDGFNSDIARLMLNVVLASGVGIKGKRAELVAAVMSMGNIQNERRVPTGHFEFTDGEKKD